MIKSEKIEELHQISIPSRQIKSIISFAILVNYLNG